MPADKLHRCFGKQAPTDDGKNMVEASEGVLDGTIKAMLSLGGNLLRALPDRERLEKVWSNLDLTVHIATKPNRSHLIPGKVSYILPCLGRTDIDQQQSGPQAVSMEDTFSHIYASIGAAEPPSDQVRSETAIVAVIAKEPLTPKPKLRRYAWVANSDTISNLIPHDVPDDSSSH